jgi:hypothetical protein
MNRRLIASGIAGAVLSLATASAHATFFSFASGVNSNSFTFAGTAGSGGSFNITDFSRPNTYNLLVDDNNGPLPTITVPVELHANLTLSGGASTQVAGLLYQHTYHVLGSFGFYDSMGNALLTVDIGPNSGLLTVPGTQTSWSTTGAVLGADSFADVTYTAHTALVSALGGTTAAAQYGISVGANGLGASLGPDDFAFDLSVLNAGAIGATVPIDPTTKAPLAAWRSESSFSGSAFGGVPAPGACGLLSLGLVLLSHRRRS